MRSFPKWQHVSAGCISALFLMGIGCTPPRGGTGQLFVERPAEVRIIRNAAGQIDFGRLQVALLNFPPKAAHKTRVAGQCATGCLVDVAIEEIGQSYDIDPLAGPARFRIIGRFTNTDANDTEGKYSMRPNTQYLVWVDAAPLNLARTSRTKWGLLELGNPAADLRTVGYVVRCHAGGYANKTSNLDIRHCDPTGPRARVTQHGAFAPGGTGIFSFAGAVAGRSNEAMYPAPETWFECDPGCCSGTSVQQ